MKALRPYQIDSVEGLRAGLRAGHRCQLLVAPTGAGKSVCAEHLISEAYRKMSRAAFICDRVVLADQFSNDHLDPAGVPHGIMQANHWRSRPGERIQVCTAQTLERRGFPEVDLVIVDEAHCARKAVTEFLAQTLARVVGLTATPFTAGLGKIYSNLVNVTTTNKLVGEGFLVPLRVYVAKAADMRGAKVVAGEWADSEVEKRGRAIIGDIVQEWIDKTLQHFQGPAKTIVFSATVAHGQELCQQFQAAGFNFQQISYKDGNDGSRKALIEEFRKPDSQIHGLVSCEVLTKGFDVPDVLVGVSARPYRKSLSAHIQQLGRVMRIAPGKQFALWLDHSGNYLRFRRDTDDVFEGGVQGIDDGELDKRVRTEPPEREKEAMTCSCGYVLLPTDEQCAACGKQHRRKSLVASVPGVMVEIEASAPGRKMPAYLRDPSSVWKQLCVYTLSKAPTEDAARRRARAMFHDFYGRWPPASEPFQKYPVWIDPALRGRITHDLIRWHKRRSLSEKVA